MEARITKGFMYLCNKDVIGGNHKYFYKKGKVYLCEKESEYPNGVEDTKTGTYLCGFITDEFGNKCHAWPYRPDLNPACHDSWGEYFTCLGEKPINVVVVPHIEGEKITWAPQNEKPITSKIQYVEAHVFKSEAVLSYQIHFKHKSGNEYRLGVPPSWIIKK